MELMLFNASSHLTVSGLTGESEPQLVFPVKCPTRNPAPSFGLDTKAREAIAKTESDFISDLEKLNPVIEVGNRQ